MDVPVSEFSFHQDTADHKHNAHINDKSWIYILNNDSKLKFETGYGTESNKKINSNLQ